MEDADFQTDPQLREQLLELSRHKKIKYSESYFKKASEKTLDSIHKDYKRKQLDEANSQLTDILIKKISELMASIETIKDSDEMEKDLVGNELFRQDIKNLVGYITPYVPLIGLLSGGATVGKHVFEKKISSDVE